MRVIPPITIDDTVLLSSTVAEPTTGVDPEPWDIAVSYVVGDRVSVLSTHKIYECLVNVTGGDTPQTSVTRAIPKWLEVGATNKWAMFDLYRSTPTIMTTNDSGYVTVIDNEATTVFKDTFSSGTNILGHIADIGGTWGNVSYFANDGSQASNVYPISNGSVYSLNQLYQNGDNPPWGGWYYGECIFNTPSLDTKSFYCKATFMWTGIRPNLSLSIVSTDYNSDFTFRILTSNNNGNTIFDGISLNWQVYEPIDGYKVDYTIFIADQLDSRIVKNVPHTMEFSYSVGDPAPVIIWDNVVQTNFREAYNDIPSGVSLGNYELIGLEMRGIFGTSGEPNTVSTSDILFLCKNTAERILSSTYVANSATVVLTTINDPDSLAVLNMKNVTSINVSAVSTEDDILRYAATYNLNNRDTQTWYGFFYDDFKPLTDLVIYDLPTNYTGLTITIVFMGSEGMSVGSCILGTNTRIGNIQRGSVNDSINYSVMERDSFGNVYLTQRDSVSKTSQKITVDKNKLNTLNTLKKTLNAVPALWVGIEDVTDPYFSAMLVLGFYREFSFAIDNPLLVDISLELEEL